MVELLVAIVASSFVVFVVLYMWNNINRHMATSKSKTQLEAEANRLGDLLTNTIRRSPEILEFDEQSITIINPNDTDTVTYSFADTSIYINETPLTFNIPSTKVTYFLIKDLNEGTGIAERHVLLNIDLKIENNLGDTASIRNSIQITRKSQVTSSESSWP
jgi:hypothetical protein